MTSRGSSLGTIGIDESGKGDYFGALVIAGAHVSVDKEAELRQLGVRDSKTLSDKRVLELARKIRAVCVTTIVAVGPERYNTLYSKLNNLNKLLAWGHARAIENVLEEVSCDTVISDQFGRKQTLENALMQHGRGVNVIQKPHAEEHIAVASASVLARAEFLTRLTNMSVEFFIDFPKGASAKVISAGKTFLDQHGADALGRVAKLHFKTTGKVMARD